MELKELYWNIRGYDGSKLIFETTVKLGQFTDDQMAQLLKALVSRAGLGYDEIVGAYAKRRTRIANNHLVVHKDFAYPTLMCGSDPHFVASVTDENGKVTRHRNLP